MFAGEELKFVKVLPKLNCKKIYINILAVLAVLAVLFLVRADLHQIEVGNGLSA